MKNVAYQDRQEDSIEEILHKYGGFPEEYRFDVCATRASGRHNNFRFFKQDVVMALVVTKGNIAQSSALLGRRRSSVMTYVVEHPEVHEFFEDLTETDLDTAEANIRKAVHLGDVKVSQFLLQSKGKNRGYGTRQEITGKDGIPIADQQVISDAASQFKQKIEEMAELHSEQAT